MAFNTKPPRPSSTFIPMPTLVKFTVLVYQWVPAMARTCLRCAHQNPTPYL